MTKIKTDLALQKHLKAAMPVVKTAALEAGKFLQKKFGRFRHLSEKPNAGLVTEADRGAEKIVVRILQKHFPHDHILAEETGVTEGQKISPFRWHIDPLDGTTNFVHGFPMFCVSIGLEYELRQLALGVIYHPMTGDLYSASLGNGAFRNKARMHVSKTKKIASALLSTGFSANKDRFLNDEMACIARISNNTRGIRRTGSAALDLTFVAAGQFDGFWERGLQPWDVAAGLVLVREAGGDFSRLDGKSYQIGDESLVATNSKIQRELLAMLNAK